MGSVALPYFKGTRYSQRMVLGSLAAGGALGNLIPPGITFIIYGLITETSVGALYIAAVGPSMLVVVLFVAGDPRAGCAAAPHATAAAPPCRSRVKLRSLVDLVPTRDPDPASCSARSMAGSRRRPKSAALGVVGAIGLRGDRGPAHLPHAQRLGRGDGAQHRADRPHPVRRLCAELRPRQPRRAAGAGQDWSAGLPLPPWAIMLLIIGFYLALGTFMEGFSMVDHHRSRWCSRSSTALGYDPIWFGVDRHDAGGDRADQPAGRHGALRAAGHAPRRRADHRRLRRRDAVRARLHARGRHADGGARASRSGCRPRCEAHASVRSIDA